MSEFVGVSQGKDLSDLATCDGPGDRRDQLTVLVAQPAGSAIKPVDLPLRHSSPNGRIAQHPNQEEADRSTPVKRSPQGCRLAATISGHRDVFAKKHLKGPEIAGVNRPRESLGDPLMLGKRRGETRSLAAKKTSGPRGRARPDGISRRTLAELDSSSLDLDRLERATLR